jgi:signal transduction histidine kinase
VGLRSPNVETGLPTTVRMVALSVQDTGIGIAEGDLEKLFQKFRQVGEQTDGRRQPGTGLGLSICKEIVEHHGGHIWAESQLGIGSRFVFTLPGEGKP